jgi:hypothetical protein
MPRCTAGTPLQPLLRWPPPPPAPLRTLSTFQKWLAWLKAAAPRPGAALEAALSRITSVSEVNHAAAAAACRGLLDAAVDDGARLAALKEASALAAAAPPGAFPAIEARYLATVAWNRGATHAKLGRPAVAAPFMAVALRLVRSAPVGGGQVVLSHDDVAKMEDEMERVKAAAAGAENGGGAAAGGTDSDGMVTN